MVDALDVLAWLAAGLGAGLLVGATRPGWGVGQRLALALVGLLGAWVGGTAAARFTNLAAVAFLGAVCLAVIGSVSLAYLLWRSGAMRYHG